MRLERIAAFPFIRRTDNLAKVLLIWLPGGFLEARELVLEEQEEEQEEKKEE